MAVSQHATWLLLLSVMSLLLGASTVTVGVMEFGHRNHAQMVALLQMYHAAYPDMTDLFSIGTSVEKRELMVLR